MGIYSGSVRNKITEQSTRDFTYENLVCLSPSKVDFIHTFMSMYILRIYPSVIKWGKSKQFTPTLKA